MEKVKTSHTLGEWEGVRETIGVSSMLRLVRRTVVFPRMLSTLDLSSEDLGVRYLDRLFITTDKSWEDIKRGYRPVFD
jgi:hypothetical protein